MAADEENILAFLKKAFKKESDPGSLTMLVLRETYCRDRHIHEEYSRERRRAFAKVVDSFFNEFASAQEAARAIKLLTPKTVTAKRSYEHRSPDGDFLPSKWAKISPEVQVEMSKDDFRPGRLSKKQAASKTGSAQPTKAAEKSVANPVDKSNSKVQARDTCEVPCVKTSLDKGPLIDTSLTTRRDVSTNGELRKSAPLHPAIANPVDKSNSKVQARDTCEVPCVKTSLDKGPLIDTSLRTRRDVSTNGELRKSVPLHPAIANPVDKSNSKVQARDTCEVPCGETSLDNGPLIDTNQTTRRDISTNGELRKSVPLHPVIAKIVDKFNSKVQARDTCEVTCLKTSSDKGPLIDTNQTTRRDVSTNGELRKSVPLHPAIANPVDKSNSKVQAGDTCEVPCVKTSSDKGPLIDTSQTTRRDVSTNEELRKSVPLHLSAGSYSKELKRTAGTSNLARQVNDSFGIVFAAKSKTLEGLSANETRPQHSSGDAHVTMGEMSRAKCEDAVDCEPQNVKCHSDRSVTMSADEFRQTLIAAMRKTNYAKLLNEELKSSKAKGGNRKETPRSDHKFAKKLKHDTKASKLDKVKSRKSKIKTKTPKKPNLGTVSDGFSTEDDEPLSNLRKRVANAEEEPKTTSNKVDEKDNDKTESELNGLENKKKKAITTKSSKDEGTKPKHTKWKATHTDPKLLLLKVYLREAGIRVKYAKIFKDCQSIESKKQVLKSILVDAGIKGEPSVAKCMKLREQRETEKQVAGIRVKYAKIFKDCEIIESKKQVLKSILVDAGIKGEPSVAKCMKLKEQRETEKEVEELLTSNIPEDSLGRTRLVT